MGKQSEPRSRTGSRPLGRAAARVVIARACFSLHAPSGPEISHISRRSARGSPRSVCNRGAKSRVVFGGERADARHEDDGASARALGARRRPRPGRVRAGVRRVFHGRLVGARHRGRGGPGFAPSTRSTATRRSRRSPTTRSTTTRRRVPRVRGAPRRARRTAPRRRVSGRFGGPHQRKQATEKSPRGGGDRVASRRGHRRARRREEGVGGDGVGRARAQARVARGARRGRAPRLDRLGGWIWIDRGRG